MQPYNTGSPRTAIFASNNGFTLIELSIVLVIIGLLIGGILVGRDLISASEIRSQIKQIEEFKTAANTFRMKYGYLPGDIPPAQTSQLGFFTFIGPYAGTSYLPLFPPYGSIRYGFGNGSGDIELGENYVFWLHLSEAKMIAGEYGRTKSGSYCIQNDTSVSPLLGGSISSCNLIEPQTKLSSPSNIDLLANLYATQLKFFITSSFPNSFNFSATPNQEFSIDSKIDDGMPDSGTIREYSTKQTSVANTSCVITSSPMSYNLSPATADKTGGCQLTVLW
jgi:prepilin-type N-terminal cleavage/methylation domain-containing protein